jgi:hypothetical protein
MTHHNDLSLLPKMIGFYREPSYRRMLCLITEIVELGGAENLVVAN